MLHDTHGLLLEQERQIATLVLDFPGPLPNLLNAARLEAIERCLETIERNPFVEILVVRSAKPTGFCAGYSREQFLDESEAVAFARTGQRVFAKLAELPIPTVALIDGPCHAAGLELALACDYRLAVATPDTWLSLTGRTCWGGRSRLRRLIGRETVDRVTAREAHAMKLVDLAFSQRRAKIELRTFLDRLEDRPRKRSTGWFPKWNRVDAAELAAFLHRPLQTEPPLLLDRVPTIRPEVPVRLVNCPQATEFAVEYLLRGGTVITDDRESVLGRLTVPLIRHRATPLELSQAVARLHGNGEARLTLQGCAGNSARAILEPYTRPIELLFGPSRSVHLADGPAAEAVASIFAAASFATENLEDMCTMDREEVASPRKNLTSTIGERQMVC